MEGIRISTSILLNSDTVLLFPIFGRGEVNLVPEGAVKVTQTTKTRLKGNFNDLKVSTGKEEFGFFNP